MNWLVPSLPQEKPVPLNEAPLSLPQSPRAASDARCWVARICRQLGRDDLVESAQTGTSELVANAILHGRAPISVRMRGTATHPRIEVRDGSPKAPMAPPHAVDPEDFLATFGRGLALVAMSATAWGASMEHDGKVVWFEPTSTFGGHEPPSPVFDSVVKTAVAPYSDRAVEVTLIGLDVELAKSLAQQYAELNRELRLLAVSHQEQYPLAADLSAMFASYERQLPREVDLAVKRALRAGESTIDLAVTVEPEAAEILTTMLEMFDLADAFCKAERLLSLQRTPAQRDFHIWYLAEFIRQIAGDDPKPFAQFDPVEPLGDQQVS